MNRTATVPVPVSLLTTLVLTLVAQDPSLLLRYLPGSPPPTPVTAAAPCTSGTGRLVHDSPGGFTVKVFRAEEETARSSSVRAAHNRGRQLRGYRTLSRSPGADRVETTGEYGPRRQRYRTFDVRFRAGSGGVYAVVVTGPAKRWPEHRKLGREAADTFCVAGG